MRRGFWVGLLLCAGCASTGFHEGRTALAKQERGYLVARQGAPKGDFERFWRAPTPRAFGLVQWQEDRSWACPGAPADLLEAIRDELGRLNQQAGSGENLALTVTIYRFDKGGIWSDPTAHYELVARDKRGQVVWAADDKIEARRELAQTLVETPNAIIARELLRKTRRAVGPLAK